MRGQITSKRPSRRSGSISCSSAARTLSRGSLDGACRRQCASLIFTCANHDSVLIASKNIGEREVLEKTWGWAAGKPTSNYQRIIKPYFPAFKLRKLPKFTAIVRHCERPFRKRLIPPINPDGSHPKWFTRLRPDYAFRQWLKFAVSKPASHS